MKKHLLYFFCFFTLVNLSAQDFIFVAFDVTKKYTPERDTDHLLIYKKDGDSYFYNYNNENYDKEKPDYELLLNETNPKRFNLQPIKNDGTLKKNFQRKHILEDNKTKIVFAEEDIVRIPWKIENVFDEFMGMKVQKATAEFRGHKWTVWFAPSIPVSTGPWKLNGLPGIILKASNDLYSFRAVYINLKESADKFPQSLEDYFNRAKEKAIPLQEAIDGENNFLKYLHSNSISNLPSGLPPDLISIEKENIREDELESVFEWK